MDVRVIGPSSLVHRAPTTLFRHKIPGDELVASRSSSPGGEPSVEGGAEEAAGTTSRTAAAEDMDGVRVRRGRRDMDDDDLDDCFQMMAGSRAAV